MQLKELINSMSSLMSVTGYEDYDLERLESLIGEFFDESFRDPVGNRFFVRRSGKENAPKILIDTHMDEIGMFVTEIHENGFLSVGHIGGLDPRILQASDVVIYGKEKIFGVIGSTPPHLQKPEDAKKIPETEELLIDTGYSKETLSEIVRIGTPVGFAPVYRELANGRLTGKGFDDKSCAACAVEGIRRAKREELAGDVYLMLSSREETGKCGGAAPGAFFTDPDYALVFDVNLGRTPDTQKNETVVVGEGISLTVCPVTDKKLTKMTEELAEHNNLKYQICVTGGSTGTNAPDINLARAGVPVVDVGLPLKSMHTGTELLDIADAECAASLIEKFICSEEIAEVFHR